MTKADLGLIGLAVMGQNLALNANDHGFTVAVFNRTSQKVDDFLKGPASKSNIIGAHSIEDFVSKLKRPRKIILMVKAGQVVDAFINQLLPHLEKGDIIIDGGNSHFPDSNRRALELAKQEILFVGAGISGGEEGARHGPSIMPGGHVKAWPYVQELLQSISAKVDNQPCCEWVGEEGSGHYVKMVHNGIEYGDMQLICEAYQILKTGLGLKAPEIQQIFQQWNRGPLNSYLIEITANIFGTNDEDGSPLIDKILDVAGQKGTGKWTAINALDLGMPLTLIGESVFARCLSSLKEERVEASEKISGPTPVFDGDAADFVQKVHGALYASKIISYAQGFMLMREAAKEYDWNLNYGAIAMMWRGGCIIRSRFLGKIKEAYEADPNLSSLLLNDFFNNEISRCQDSWRDIVSTGAQWGIPTPCFSTALAFFDGYRTARLPANLLQAQRDYFGAHTYERTDKPRGAFFHTNWTGTGGKVASSTYNA